MWCVCKKSVALTWKQAYSYLCKIVRLSHFTFLCRIFFNLLNLHSHIHSSDHTRNYTWVVSKHKHILLYETYVDVQEQLYSHSQFRIVVLLHTPDCCCILIHFFLQLFADSFTSTWKTSKSIWEIQHWSSALYRTMCVHMLRCPAGIVARRYYCPIYQMLVSTAWGIKIFVWWWCFHERHIYMCTYKCTYMCWNL